MRGTACYAPAEIGEKIYVDSSERKITKLGLEKSSAKILPAHKTVLFTSRAGIGNTAILLTPAATNQGFQSMVLHDDINPYFVFSMTDMIKGKAERVGVRTYNYDLKGGKLVNLSDLIKLKETTVNKVQSIINSDIKQAYNNAKIIAVEYGTLYERDLSSDIYKVENAENFFLTQDGNVYIVYAYGNNDYTNEMDIIIF